MTEEEYLVIQKQPEIPMPTWFEFYQERGGVLPYDEFVHYFTTVLRNQSVVRSSSYGLKQITFKSALDNFFNYYNKKFRLDERFTTETSSEGVS